MRISNTLKYLIENIDKMINEDLHNEEFEFCDDYYRNSFKKIVNLWTGTSGCYKNNDNFSYLTNDENVVRIELENGNVETEFIDDDLPIIYNKNSEIMSKDKRLFLYAIYGMGFVNFLKLIDILDKEIGDYHVTYASFYTQKVLVENDMLKPLTLNENEIIENDGIEDNLIDYFKYFS